MAARLTSEAAPSPASGRATLYLASKSPRRADLLRRHGIAFEIVDSGIDDSGMSNPRVTPAQWVAALAYLKAWGGRHTLGARAGHAVVLGSDTVVVKDGRIIGQPRDEDDARRIVRDLDSGSHEVATGVAIIRADGGRTIFSDRARVRVGAIGAARIDEYIASGQWRGKAGAYNLEERLGAGWPIEYEGDPGTIMGLPMRRLAPLLLPSHAAVSEHAGLADA